MDRSNFYYLQNVTQAELDQVFDDTENAIDQRVSDQIDGSHATWGICNGLEVEEQASPDLTVKVTDGIAYDKNGKRVVHSGGPTNLDLTSLVPATGGESVYVRVYAERDTVESDARTDGDGIPLNYRIADSVTLSLDAGTAAPSPTRPAIDDTKVLLATILLTNGQSQIQTADISMALGLGYDTAVAREKDRQEGGTFAHGRNNTRVLSFEDPGGVNRGNRIQLGNNNLDTERGNILLASDTDIDNGGKIYMQEGSIRRANQIFSADPFTSDQGFLYHDPATGDKEGSQITLEKWVSYSCRALSPGDNNNKEPWQGGVSVGLNAWYIGAQTIDWSGGVSPTPVSMPAWRVRARPSGGTPAYTWPLFCPLIALPHGSRLDEVEFFCRCPGAVQSSQERVYMEVWRHAHDTTTILGTHEEMLNTTGYYRIGPTISGGEIVDNETYQYVAVIWVKHLTDPGEKDTLFVTGARAKISIREASGIY